MIFKKIYFIDYKNKNPKDVINEINIYLEENKDRLIHFKYKRQEIYK